MESEPDAAFNLIETSLLVAPPVTLVAFFALARRWPSALRVLVCACAMIVCGLLCCMTFGFSLTDDYNNFLCFDAGFVAYCFCAVSCFRIRPGYRRVLALVLTSLPILFGYTLGTVGVLGLSLEIGQDTETPDSVQVMGPGLICMTSAWGVAGSVGENIDLYKRWSRLPFLQRDVEHGSYSPDDPGDVEFPVSCEGALEAYRK